MLLSFPVRIPTGVLTSVGGFLVRPISFGLMIGLTTHTALAMDYSKLEWVLLKYESDMPLTDPNRIEHDGKRLDLYAFEVIDFEEEFEIELFTKRSRSGERLLTLFELKAFNGAWQPLSLESDLDVDYCGQKEVIQSFDIPENSRYLLLSPKAHSDQEWMTHWCVTWVIFPLPIPYPKKFKVTDEVHHAVSLKTWGLPDRPEFDTSSDTNMVTQQESSYQIEFGLGVQTYFHSFRFHQSEERIRVESSVSGFMGLDLALGDGWYSRTRLGAYDTPSYNIQLTHDDNVDNSPPIYRGLYAQSGALYGDDNWYLGAGLHYQFGQKIGLDHGPRYDMDSSFGGFLSAEYRYQSMQFQLEYRKVPQKGPDGTHFSGDNLGLNVSLRL